MPDITISIPSAKSLLIQTFFDSTQLGTATGIICSTARGPVLITNWHVCSGRHPTTKQPLSSMGATPNKIKIVHNKSNKLGEWLIKEEALYQSNGKPLWIEHPVLSDRVDVVALPLTSLVDVEIYPYDLSGGPDIVVNPAEIVSVVGFPFGLQVGGSLAVWATGFVASEPRIDYNDLPIFLIDSRTRPGQSGSAVIVHRNGGAVTMADGSTAIMAGPVTKFLGIYSGRINEQSDLGMVWKAAAVGEIISAI